MNDIARNAHTGFSTAASMSSREIADLVSVRHDNVRRTIETLAERGIISLPQFEEVKIQRERRAETVMVYVFSGEQGKRDSIVVVAQLSPEFTARLVDRWQQLEAELRERTSYAPPRRPARIEIARESRLTMNLNLKLAKMAGLSGNQALLSANRATVAMTGIDNLKLLGVSHMDAPQNEALLTPTEIGRRTGIGSAQAVNNRLCDKGFQYAGRDLKGHVYYEPTEAGLRAGAVMQDTGKKHSTGTPVRQLRWASSIVAELDGYGGERLM